MRAIDCRPPWTAQLRYISWCWTAGRKTETTDPSLSRLSAFWTSLSGTQAVWRSSPVRQQGDTFDFASCTHSEMNVFSISKMLICFFHFPSCILWYLYSSRLERRVFFFFLNFQEEISCYLMIMITFWNFLTSILTRSMYTFRLEYLDNRNPGHIAPFHSLLFKQKTNKKKEISWSGGEF